jgi:hypothetical protein
LVLSSAFSHPSGISDVTLEFRAHSVDFSKLWVDLLDGILAGIALSMVTEDDLVEPRLGLLITYRFDLRWIKNRFLMTVDLAT